MAVVGREEAMARCTHPRSYHTEGAQVAAVDGLAALAHKVAHARLGDRLRARLAHDLVACDAIHALVASRHVRPHRQHLATHLMRVPHVGARPASGVLGTCGQDDPKTRLGGLEKGQRLEVTREAGRQGGEEVGVGWVGRRRQEVATAVGSVLTCFTRASM